MPNLTVTVLFMQNSTLYQATKIIKVPPAQQRLQVQITPAKDVLQPQQSVAYDVFTRDASGKPASADVSFGVVDEAIYSLYPDISGDMIGVLYPLRSIQASVDTSLDYYFSGEAGDKSPMLAMREARYRPQLAQVKPGNEAKPRVRKAFPDTAFWAPNVHTDATGHAHVTLHVPRLADDMAHHRPCDHRGHEGGVRDQPRAGAQECHRAHGHTALHDQGRRDHASSDRTQLPRHLRYRQRFL